MVEKEIYEVYKFIQDSQPKHNKGCEQKDKASSPPKVAGTRPKQAKKNGLQRPMSAVKMHLQPSLEERLLHELKSLKLDNGPRIAINKRLASKI